MSEILFVFIYNKAKRNRGDGFINMIDDHSLLFLLPCTAAFTFLNSSLFNSILRSITDVQRRNFSWSSFLDERERKERHEACASSSRGRLFPSPFHLFEE